MHRCVTTLERVGDEASNAGKRDEALAAYSTALSLGATIPNTIMIKWANMTLKTGLAHEATSAATKVHMLFVMVQKRISTLFRFSSRFRGLSSTASFATF